MEQTEFRNFYTIVDGYKKVINNTKEYRAMWGKGTKEMITNVLEQLNTATKLEGNVHTEESVESLEMVVLDLGKIESGIAQRINETDTQRVFRSNGALAYQQLFNGKIVCWMNYPYIDGVGEPRPPKTIEIVRPTEINDAVILRHMELFIKELTAWEDFDDDIPQKIGFQRHAAIPEQ